MRCPYCEGELDEEYYCSTCGAELREDEVDFTDEEEY